MKGILAAALLLMMASCSYRQGKAGGLACSYPSISVPYAVGDRDGSLTSAIVKEVVRSGAFEFRYSLAALILNVVVIDIDEEDIGFRYDRKKRGKLTKDIIPTEERMTIVVEVSVTEAASCCTVLGPVRLSACVDYDHDYYSSRDGINIFSLGQLTDLDEAYNTAESPLFREIAKKIVDYVTQSW